VAVSKAGRWGRSLPLTHKERRNKMNKNSKTEEKLKQTFCFKLLKSVNKMLLRHQWPCNKLRLSSNFILKMSGTRGDPVHD